MKNIKIFDCLVVAILIVALVVGFLTYKGKRATSQKQIEATANVEVEVFLRGVTSTSGSPLMKKDDETFITIRNVPYTKLKIKDVKYDRKKALLPSTNPKRQFILVNDESLPFQYDYLVTISDKAKVTKEGDIVLGGNKVKIGLPITLEGAKYRLNGIITNVSAVE